MPMSPIIEMTPSIGSASIMSSGRCSLISAYVRKPRSLPSTISVFRRRLRASTSAGVSTRGAISAWRPFLPFREAASSARLPASLAAISPGVALCAGAPLPGATGPPLPPRTGMPLATGGSLPLPFAGMTGFAATALAFLGRGLATTLAASFPLGACLPATLDLGTVFLPALATGLRAGFFGAALRLAECADFFAAGLRAALLREAGLADRFAFFRLACLPALRVADLAERAFAFTFDLVGDLRLCFVGFLAMVILDGNGLRCATLI